MTDPLPLILLALLQLVTLLLWMRDRAEWREERRALLERAVPGLRIAAEVVTDEPEKQWPDDI